MGSFPVSAEFSFRAKMGVVSGNVSWAGAEIKNPGSRAARRVIMIFCMDLWVKGSSLLAFSSGTGFRGEGRSPLHLQISFIVTNHLALGGF